MVKIYNIIKLIIILSIINGYSTQAYGQNLEPIFHSINDKLPSSEVYDIYQDELGYLWITTDMGLVKYDGGEFQSIDVFSQIKTKTIFNFHEESSEKIWVNTNGNKLFWFNPFDDQFKLLPYEQNNLLTNSINSINSLQDKEYIKKFHFYNDNLFVTFFRGTGYLKISKNGEVEIESKTNDRKNLKNKSNYIINAHNSNVFTDFLDENIKNPQLFYVNEDTIVLDREPNLSKFDYHGISGKLAIGKDQFITFNKYLIVIKPDTVLWKKLPFNTQCVSVVNNQILIGTVKGVYQLNKELEISDNFLKDFTITSILIDKNKGYWFSTLEKGIFYTPNLNIKYIPNSDKLNTTYLAFEEDSLLIFNNNNELFLYTNQLINLNQKINKNNEFIRSSSNQLSNFFHPINVIKDEFGGFIYDYLEKPVNYIAKQKYISNYCDKEFFTYKADKSIPSFYDCTQLNDSILLILTKKGLYNFNIIDRSLDKHAIYQNYSFYQVDKLGNHIILNSSNGIYEYKVGQLYQLSTNYFNLYIENDSVIWLYSDLGLFSVQVDELSNFSVKKFSNDNGLISNNIQTIDVDSNQLWIGTRKGINYIKDYTKIDNIGLKVQNFFIDSIISNKIKLNNSDTIQFKYGKELNIYFKYLDYFKEIQIDYKINNGDYIKTNNRNINIQGLDIGLHKLIFKIKKDSGECIYIEKYFFVPTPFYKGWPFKILILMIFGLFFFLIFRIYFNYKSNQKEKEIKRLKLELNQLNSQMNPHFTFNTINSIQHYILKNDKHKAIAYLSDFALMMRKTLEMSKKGTINLSNELEFLKLYIELENKRFESPFQLKLELDDSINLKKTFIPPLMLQPLIENSVKHAFGVNDENKIIKINFTKGNGFILISVIDNGIGFKQNTIEKKHESYALELIINRLRIFNSQKFKNSDFKIGFVDENKKTGTIITLKIYQNENFNS